MLINKIRSFSLHYHCNIHKDNNQHHYHTNNISNIKEKPSIYIEIEIKVAHNIYKDISSLCVSRNVRIIL